MSQFFHGCSFATKGSILTKGILFCLVMNSPNYGEAYTLIKDFYILYIEKGKQ